MVLKMTIEKAARALSIDVDVENTDITSAKGMDCDAIFTSHELAETFENVTRPKIVPIKRYMDLKEVKEALEKL